MNPTKIVLSILLILIALGGVGSCRINGCGRGYSEGTRIGVVTKLSRKGFIFKSLEGEALIGGFDASSDGGTMTPRTFEFSVESQDVADRLTKFASEGARVVLTYEQYAIQPARLQTSYVVVQAEPAK